MGLKRIRVDLIIEENEPGDAEYVVDALLDAGFFQDAIDDHDAEAGKLHVRRATARDATTAPCDHDYGFLSCEKDSACPNAPLLVDE